jgi:iron complex transport system permease protein
MTDSEYITTSSPERERFLAETDDPLISKKTIRALTKWTRERQPTEADKESYKQYDTYVWRKWVFMFCCVLVMFVTAGLACTIGPMDITFMETYETIWNHITNNIQNTAYDYTIIDLRTPRIIMAIAAGAGLAICGACMQSTLMNPLADPYTTGVSSGASFGATMAMLAGVTILGGKYYIVGNAFVFSLIPTALIVGLAKIKKSSPTTMIMAGIAVMYIFNAFTTVMMLMADPNDLQAVYEWQVGSVAKASWDDIMVSLCFVIPGTIIVMLLSKKLNVLSTGDDMASSLGVDASKLRTFMMILVALITASIVSFVGLIGFVGLVAPHMVRLFMGADNRYLVPASAMFGAALLVVSDLVGRVIIAPAVLQVGVITAFIGGPVFLWLLLRKNSNVW